MTEAFRKIRFKFLYVCAGSALLSALLMYVLYRTSAYVYASDLPGSALFAKLVNWLINHIGKIPVGLLVGGMLFLLGFYYRSSKIKDDVVRLLNASIVEPCETDAKKEEN